MECHRAERYRGSSEVQLIDGDPESKRPWRTTNQVFAACAREQGTIGLANPGIASDVARRLHKQQDIYGKKRVALAGPCAPSTRHTHRPALPGPCSMCWLAGLAELPRVCVKHQLPGWSGSLAQSGAQAAQAAGRLWQVEDYFSIRPLRGG